MLLPVKLFTVAATTAAVTASAATSDGPQYHLVTPGALAGVASVAKSHDTPFPELLFHSFFLNDSAPTGPWVHYTSNDGVRWTLSSTDTSSPIGANGGSVTAILPNLSPAVNDSTVAIALASPTSTSGGAVTAFSSDSPTLDDFTPIAGSAACSGKGVICPSEEPAGSALPLGDAWTFQDGNLNGTNVALVVANGTGIEVFSSQNLVDWTAVAPLGLPAQPQTISSPELYNLHDERSTAILTWNAGDGKTSNWARGPFDPQKLTFQPTTTGVGDSGAFQNGKSFFDALGNRAQYGTIAVTGASPATVLSLPRNVFNRDDGSVGFGPHASVWKVTTFILDFRMLYHVCLPLLNLCTIVPVFFNIVICFCRGIGNVCPRTDANT